MGLSGRRKTARRKKNDGSKQEGGRSKAPEDSKRLKKVANNLSFEA